MGIKLTSHGSKQKIKGKKGAKSKFKFKVSGLKDEAGLLLKGTSETTGIYYEWAYAFPATGATDGDKDVEVECKEGQAAASPRLGADDIVLVTVTITNPDPTDSDEITEEVIVV